MYWSCEAMGISPLALMVCILISVTGFFVGIGMARPMMKDLLRDLKVRYPKKGWDDHWKHRQELQDGQSFIIEMISLPIRIRATKLTYTQVEQRMASRHRRCFDRVLEEVQQEDGSWKELHEGESPFGDLRFKDV